MTTPATVTIGMNNSLPADEAAKFLGCSYSHLINLINKNKLKAQRRERQWFVDYEDLQRAKTTNLVRPRQKRSLRAVPIKPISSDQVEIRLSVARDKFDLINFACKNSTKAKKGEITLLGLLNEKLDSIYDQVQKQLASVSL